MYLLYSVNVYIFNVVIEIKFYSILFYSMMIITLFINLQIDSLKVRCQDSDTDSHHHQYVAARLLLSVTLVSRKPNEGKSP